jgi:putative endonuclease
MLGSLQKGWHSLKNQFARVRLLFHKPLGYRGEQLAARFLRRQGCHVIGRGVRLRGGELDLIVEHDGTVVFVEVKTRRLQIQGESLGETVTAEKERRITRAAYAYLKKHRLLEYPVRFDVITILWAKGKRPEVRHHPHAFEAAGEESSLY